MFFYDPTTEFDRFFADALVARPRACAPSTVATHPASRHRNVYHPRLDLYESKDTDTVTAMFELPGLTSDCVAIDVHQHCLTVSGESATSAESGEERDYIIRERHPGKFSRSLQLPFGTRSEDVKAKMENGILTITFPKISPEQQVKRIAIE